MAELGELIVSPPITTAIAKHLTAELASLEPMHGLGAVRAAGRVPTPRPDVFVRIEVVGGGDGGIMHDVATVVAESYAATEADAEQLASIVDGILLRAGRVGRIDELDVTYVTRVSRPQRLPDPTTDQARYTATHEIKTRNRVL